MEQQLFPRKRAFFYHYNKHLSAKAGHPIMTVHLGGKCYFARSLQVDVACVTKERKVQPRLVLHGYCSGISITDNLITLS